MKLHYPVKVPFVKCIDLERWKLSAVPFFTVYLKKYSYTDSDRASLQSYTESIKSGKIVYFTKEVIDLGSDYDWLTNPENGFKFKRDEHWSNVKDIDSTQGDIKYVWEKARFSFLLTIIRNDQANAEDNSSFVWKEILSWIDNTSYNCGPHYKCSQEISLRILNWIFALYYYKNSSSLTNEIFSKILNSIYWQTKHVEQNIMFSKIAVRNNHAITESLCLFTTGLLFPWFPDAKRWCKRGKGYLEEEGLYQIYEDGSYIQHSFNYQRVVIQLYTWALALARCNQILFSAELIDRLKKSVDFLRLFANTETGYVPNWGANDSALFFPLNSCNSNDFRPQINALTAVLSGEMVYNEKVYSEDLYWFGLDANNLKMADQSETKVAGVKSNPVGGYYILTNQKASTFIRCTRYKHRPYHADNLHVDIWYNNKNIVRDAGTYKYNTDPETAKFFSGTSGHNTIMIDKFDQMEKGSRFIWFNWSESLCANVKEEQDYLHFEGTIAAFKHVRNGIVHKRSVNAIKGIPLWVVNDTITNTEGYQITQHWNISECFYESDFRIRAQSDGKDLEPTLKKVWYSESYGQKIPAEQLVFTTAKDSIVTLIYHTSVENYIGKYLK